MQKTPNINTIITKKNTNISLNPTKPFSETLSAITEWEESDPEGWLDYVQKAWDNHYGLAWTENGFLKLATGGLSDNEAIVRAMRSHPVLWPLLWESSHCGGLEVLRLPNDCRWE